AAIMISTFGCNNGLILSGARVYYAMSRDDLFFKSAGLLHPQYKTPAVALVVHAVWTSVLCLSGSYSQLLNYVIFAALVFYMLTAAGLFALRGKRPGAERPVRAPGYPWVPALYVVLTGVIALDLLLNTTTRTYSALGLGFVRAGRLSSFVRWSPASAKGASARASVPGRCGSLRRSVVFAGTPAGGGAGSRATTRKRVWLCGSSSIRSARIASP